MRLLQTSGEQSKAQDKLRALATQHADDRNFLRKLERLSAEPLSADARANVARLTKSGIAAYQNKEYNEASRIFKEALGLFPNHVGLNLNLVQVLLERSDNALGEKDSAQIKRCFERVKDIAEDNAQFARAQALKRQFEKARQAA